MATERTLSIIKPDATRRNITGAINKMIEEANLSIVAQHRRRLSKAEAEGFYSVHKERAFFDDLVSSMTSGPVVVQVLEGDNAIKVYRDLMGATNPSQAEDGTIRKLFGENIEANSVHGSDALKTAKSEISFMFSEGELTLLS